MHCLTSRALASLASSAAISAPTSVRTAAMAARSSSSSGKTTPKPFRLGRITAPTWSCQNKVHLRETGCRADRFLPVEHDLDPGLVGDADQKRPRTPGRVVDGRPLRDAGIADTDEHKPQVGRHDECGGELSARPSQIAPPRRECHSDWCPGSALHAPRDLSVVSCANECNCCSGGASLPRLRHVPQHACDDPPKRRGADGDQYQTPPSVGPIGRPSAPIEGSDK